MRVIAAMRELDYYPNAIARALVDRSHDRLAASSASTRRLYGQRQRCSRSTCRPRRPATSSSSPAFKALNRDSIADAVERLRVHGVDGILVITPLREGAEALPMSPEVFHWWRSRRGRTR